MKTVKRGLRYNNMRGDDSDSPTARQKSHSGTWVWRGAVCVVFERCWQERPEMERCYQIALWDVQNPVGFFYFFFFFFTCHLIVIQDVLASAWFRCDSKLELSWSFV